MTEQDEPYEDYDESDARVRPNRKGTRARTKQRPAHEAAVPGRVVTVAVSKGDEVAAGQRLLVLEAMKMEQALVAPFAGRVAELTVAAGAQVVKPNGEALTAANIGPVLAARDLAADLRAADPFRQGGGRAFGAQDRSRFLDALDRALR